MDSFFFFDTDGTSEMPERERERRKGNIYVEEKCKGGEGKMAKIQGHGGDR